MPSPTGYTPIYNWPVAYWDYRVAALQGEGFSGTTPTWLYKNDVTFSFPQPGSVWLNGANYGQGEVGAWMPFNSEQQQAARDALALWASVADIDFWELPDTSTTVGDIRLALTFNLTGTSMGHAYAPGELPSGGDVWMDADNAGKTFSVRTGYWKMSEWGTIDGPVYDLSAAARFIALMHEIGHANGLSHPFAVAGANRATPPLPADELKPIFTVMAYPVSETVLPQTPMPYDILAMQWLYGPNTTYRTGDDTYDFDIAQVTLQTIWDAGGTDTIRATDVQGRLHVGSVGVVIDLRQGIDPTQIDDIHNRDVLASSAGTASVYNFELWQGGGSRIGWGNLNHYAPNIAPTVFIAYNVDVENAIGLDGPNDTLIGNSLRNTLIGRGGSDYIDGNGDIDTAVFEHARSSYAISKDSWGVGGSTRLIVAAAEGTDVLVDVERLKFADGYLAFDIEGNGGQAYRLYQAAFDRTPDIPGLGYQTIALDIGLSLSQVAANFIASPEFQGTYGAVNNQQFVTLLYRNVLDREPEQAGLQYHVDRLAAGATRADVLVGFSESPENKANVIGQIQDGMFYTL